MDFEIIKPICENRWVLFEKTLFAAIAVGGHFEFCYSFFALLLRNLFQICTANECAQFNILADKIILSRFGG